MKLRRAIAAERPQSFPGDALGMDADQRRASPYFAEDQRLSGLRAAHGTLFQVPLKGNHSK